MENGDITTDNVEIHNITRNYFENLYSNKIENQEEIDKFLDTCNLPKLHHEDRENLNKPVVSKEIKIAIMSLPSKKS